MPDLPEPGEEPTFEELNNLLKVLVAGSFYNFSPEIQARWAYVLSLIEKNRRLGKYNSQWKPPKGKVKPFKDKSSGQTYFRTFYAVAVCAVEPWYPSRPRKSFGAKKPGKPQQPNSAGMPTFIHCWGIPSAPSTPGSGPGPGNKPQQL